MGEACSMNEESENFIQTLVGKHDEKDISIDRA
jgi:hypothetical protein